MGIISILAIVFAIAATVLAFIFIVPEKNKDKFGVVGRILHDVFNFKFLVIEKVLQALYILSTAATVFFGFFMLFYVQPGYHSFYYSRPAKWYGGYGLLIMILGPILVRLVYEGLMLTILLIKNVIQINNKLKSENADNSNDIFATPVAPVIKKATAAPEAPATPVAPVVPAAPEAPATPVAPVAPAPAPVAPAPAPVAPAPASVAPVASEGNVCATCGKVIDSNAVFCPYCGTKKL